MTTFDRKTFFDAVRKPLFSGSMTQQQVDGMSYKLDVWEKHHNGRDVRWLAYALATSKHETASTMWPVEEYGKGAGRPYGEPVKETGFAYYGRGDVQLTWDYNYKGASSRLGLNGSSDDLYWHPDRALDPVISADVMYSGMIEGWFRSPNSLDDYFSPSRDDPYNARDIINGDKKTIPQWSNGISIGNLVAGYHRDFLSALNAAARDEPAPPEPAVITMTVPAGVRLIINGIEWP
jgi:hypothetical protein